MRKLRVYELAKNLNFTSKEMINNLQDLGLEVTSHMQILSGSELEMVEEIYSSEEKTNSETNEKDNKTENTNKEEIVKDKELKKSKNKRKNNKRVNKAKDSNSKKMDNSLNENKNLEEIEHFDENIINIPESIQVLELAERMDQSVNQVIMTLMGLGVMANQNQEIDYETAAIVASEFGFAPMEKEDEISESDLDFNELASLKLDYEDDEDSLKPRPPVITVMGHVDHGKTSLLDAIRDTNVTRGEAGGITQHIGASVVEVDGKDVIFLDTPGHEAFTSMRARGASVTDLAILVVAADDGVMPQTIEAISHAKAANVPIVVAINKMDKEGANQNIVLQELSEHDILSEDWGGDVVTVPVSALNGDGIDELLEITLMIAEMEELKANPNRDAVGYIIEANLDKGRGPVATVLVEKGTLRTGDSVVSGATSGRIRAMFNDKGENVEEAGPSYPVQILGLSEVPNSGDMVYVVKDEREARSIADNQKQRNKDNKLKVNDSVSLDDLFGQIQEGDFKELNLVVKTDVRGTIDAVASSMAKLSNEEVKVNIIHSAVGGITESDVMLARASNALIIGFNVRPGQIAEEAAKDQGIEIRTYSVIYDAIEDIKDAIKGMLDPIFEEEVIARADVRQVFKVPKIGNIAGIYVTNGKILRNAMVRLLRNDVIVAEGEISSLKRYQDDVRELAEGFEGGLGIENYNDIKEGDRLEIFHMKEVER